MYLHVNRLVYVIKINQDLYFYDPRFVNTKVKEKRKSKIITPSKFHDNDFFTVNYFSGFCPSAQAWKSHFVRYIFMATYTDFITGFHKKCVGFVRLDKTHSNEYIKSNNFSLKSAIIIKLKFPDIHVYLYQVNGNGVTVNSDVWSHSKGFTF